MTIFGLKRGLAGGALALTLSCTACSVRLDSLPLPAPGVDGDSYSLTATFSNALNLPMKAKVKLNGADIGEVESMVAKDYTAVVTMRIRSGALLPAGTTAELRSATPLGDVFVALTPPPHPDPSAANLGDGASIPLPSTAAAATIEEVLTRAALLVNGGAIANVTELVNNFGAAVGGRGDRLAELIAQTRQLLAGLAARSDQIRDVLATMGTLSSTLAAQQSAIADASAAAGPALQVIGDNTQNLVDLIGRINQMARQLAQFPSINGSNNQSLIANVNLLAQDLNNAAESPKANLDTLNLILPMILKVIDAQSSHVYADIVQLAIGAVPDPNFPGDPGARVPDQSDWANFVGSLAYTLNRLNQRLNGPGR
ncbi:MlaD family protein [Nocardia sp. NBC_00565]|uniref:MlaD family protein n=1 Tax=Nocardia sp. NBC_00565 TaxID=2975993 RepID=UPI002E81DE17|nr:MlaD family protein [Nocardia sp. NBC_00565]WUC05852.1 MlaD family protein [Nocardia sp. NBC_00565]